MIDSKSNEMKLTTYANKLMDRTECTADLQGVQESTLYIITMEKYYLY